MNDPTYEMIEVTGTSTTSTDEAIQNAVAKASDKVHTMRWFEVVETRGAIEDSRVKQWQVTLKIWFALKD